MSTTTATIAAEAVAEAGFCWESMSDRQRNEITELVSVGYEVTEYPHLLDPDEFAAWAAETDELDREAAAEAQRAMDLATVAAQLRRDGWAEADIETEMATAKFGTFGGEVAVETQGGIWLMGRKA